MDFVVLLPWYHACKRFRFISLVWVLGCRFKFIDKDDGNTTDENQLSLRYLQFIIITYLLGLKCCVSGSDFKMSSLRRRKSVLHSIRPQKAHTASTGQITISTQIRNTNVDDIPKDKISFLCRPAYTNLLLLFSGGRLNIHTWSNPLKIHDTDGWGRLSHAGRS